MAGTEPSSGEAAPKGWTEHETEAIEVDETVIDIYLALRCFRP